MKMEIHYSEKEDRIEVIECVDYNEAMEFFYSEMNVGNNLLLTEIKRGESSTNG